MSNERISTPGVAVQEATPVQPLEPIPESLAPPQTVPVRKSLSSNNRRPADAKIAPKNVDGVPLLEKKSGPSKTIVIGGILAVIVILGVGLGLGLGIGLNKAPPSPSSPTVYSSATVQTTFPGITLSSLNSSYLATFTADVNNRVATSLGLPNTSATTTNHGCNYRQEESLSGWRHSLYGAPPALLYWAAGVFFDL